MFPRHTINIFITNFFASTCTPALITEKPDGRCRFLPQTSAQSHRRRPGLTLFLQFNAQGYWQERKSKPLQGEEFFGKIMEMQIPFVSTENSQTMTSQQILQSDLLDIL